MPDSLGAVGARLLDPDDTLRMKALEYLPADSGLSAEMATVVAEQGSWTGERLLGNFPPEPRIAPPIGVSPGPVEYTGEV